MSDFLESLSEFMNDYNLNNFRLSKLLGISSTAVNGYFNYGSIPNIYTAIKMCKIFGCSLDYLFGLSDSIKTDYEVDTETFMQKFNYNIERLIKENNLSIAKTMRDLKLDEYTFYHWKHGKIPKTTNLITIAKYFDTSIDSLLGEEKKKEIKHK